VSAELWNGSIAFNQWSQSFSTCLGIWAIKFYQSLFNFIRRLHFPLMLLSIFLSILTLQFLLI
jgi:hypothetical protein